jgi:lipopolysaccharide export system permease protein
LRYYLSFLPIIFTQIAPIALLLSVLYAVGTLNRHNEIVAMKASGVSLWRIITPLLFLALIVSLISFVVENKIVPGSYLIYSHIKEEELRSEAKKPKQEIIRDVTLYGANNRIYYAESFDISEGILNKLIIFQLDDKGSIVARITADKARWEEDKWIMNNCAIYRLSESGVVTGEPLFFNEKIFRIPESPEDFIRSKDQIQFMSIFAVYGHIKKLSGNGYRPAGLLIDFYNKISYPFINFIVVLMGISFAFLPNKGGTFIYLAIALVVGFLYYATIIISMHMGRAGLIPPLLSSWLANIIFACVGIIFIIRLPK